MSVTWFLALLHASLRVNDAMPGSSIIQGVQGGGIQCLDDHIEPSFCASFHSGA